MCVSVSVSVSVSVYVSVYRSERYRGRTLEVLVEERNVKQPEQVYTHTHTHTPTYLYICTIYVHIYLYYVHIYTIYVHIYTPIHITTYIYPYIHRCIWWRSASQHSIDGYRHRYRYRYRYRCIYISI